MTCPARWPTLRADDRGMSLVEVLVASVILLIVLTSMLALLLTTTGMSAKARAESLAVNTANRLVEQVRGLHYADITQTKLDELATAAAGTVGGMTVSVAASTTPHWEASQLSSERPAYQEVRVQVSITGPGFKAYTLRTGTYVREWKWSGSTATTEGTPPTVQFDSGTPPAGATSRPIHGLVHIGATAQSGMVDVVLTQVYVKWLTSYLATSTPDAVTGSCASDWNTELLPEGRKVTLFAEAWDALNQNDSKSRDFIIDNVVPPAPAAVTLVSVTGNSSARYAWTKSMDGEAAAPDYLVTWKKQSASGTWVGTVLAPVVDAYPTNASFSPFVDLPTEAFSLYHPEVQARGPRAQIGDPTDWMSTATQGPRLVSRPAIGGTVNVTASAQTDKFTFSATLNATPPTFQSSSTTYRWQYQMGSNKSWVDFTSATAPNTNPSTADTVSFSNVKASANGVPDTLSLRCLITTTTSLGTVVGKTQMARIANPGVGSHSLASGTQDWTTW